MDRKYDPRSIVTPYAFAVHPDLLGLPLATPWQRLAAILIDLVAIGLLTLFSPTLLAVGLASLLLWLAFRKPAQEAIGKVFRIAAGCLGVAVLGLAAMIVLVIRYGADLEQAAEDLASQYQVGIVSPEGPLGVSSGPTGEGSLLGLMEAVRGAAGFARAETREEAQARANELAREAYDLHASRADIREVLTELIPREAPWAAEADELIDEAIRSLPSPQPPGIGDSAASAGQAAAEGGEEEVLGPIAQDSIARLTRALELERERRADAEEARARAQATLEARQTGILGWFWNLIDDLGLGFGWGALYLTLTHAWWRGTSIGKRLLKIRVVPIDRRPLGWWLSFERAGGYAAGFATGLLGFLQIFWDPNRQAIHDKVSETIVIQDGKKPVPGPWIAEGKELWARGRPRRREHDGRSWVHPGSPSNPEGRDTL